MPFLSKKHRKFMFLKHPKTAKKWMKKYGSKIQPKKEEVKTESISDFLKKQKPKKVSAERG